MEKSKNPASAVDVARLEALVVETPTRQERIASPETDRLLVRAAESLQRPRLRRGRRRRRTGPSGPSRKPGRHRDPPQGPREEERAAAVRGRPAESDRGARGTPRRRSSCRAREDESGSIAEHPAVALLERKLAAATASRGRARRIDQSGPEPPRRSRLRSPTAGSLGILSLDLPVARRQPGRGAAASGPRRGGQRTALDLGPEPLRELVRGGAGARTRPLAFTAARTPPETSAAFRSTSRRRRPTSRSPPTRRPRPTRTFPSPSSRRPPKPLRSLRRNSRRSHRCSTAETRPRARATGSRPSRSGRGSSSSTSTIPTPSAESKRRGRRCRKATSAWPRA